LAQQFCDLLLPHLSGRYVLSQSVRAAARIIAEVGFWCQFAIQRDAQPKAPQPALDSAKVCEVDQGLYGQYYLLGQHQDDAAKNHDIHQDQDSNDQPVPDIQRV
jgi:hypothetical protein